MQELNIPREALQKYHYGSQVHSLFPLDQNYSHLSSLLPSSCKLSGILSSGSFPFRQLVVKVALVPRALILFLSRFNRGEKKYLKKTV